MVFISHSFAAALYDPAAEGGARLGHEGGGALLHGAALAALRAVAATRPGQELAKMHVHRAGVRR